ncbi:MAG: WG repeat-containing protein [Chitinophagaceae bacterium]|nr:MAG: WG repeat-containing protein [Chitinophagaceae bacterium]
MKKFLYGYLLACMAQCFITDAVAQSSSPAVLDYAKVDDFHEGFALVRKGENYSIIDRNGKQLVPLGLYDLGSGSAFLPESGFRDGRCLVKDAATGLYGFIDTSGWLVVPCQFEQAYAFKNGYASGHTMDEKRKYEYYFVDPKGQCYNTPSSAMQQRENVFIIKDNVTFPLKDYYRKNGTKAFTSENIIWEYAEGLYKTSLRSAGNEGKYGYIDTTGKMVIPMRINTRAELGVFSEGLLSYRPQFQDEYHLAYLDRQGNEVFRIPADAGITRVSMWRDFRYGYADCEVNTAERSNIRSVIDHQGNIIVIEDLFRKMNPGFERDRSDVFRTRYNFTYSGRDQSGIRFTIDIALKPGSETARMLGIGTGSATGGVGGGQRFIEVKAMGMMDYTGRLIIPPVFYQLAGHDPDSGLAKAVYVSSSRETVQGFVGNGPGFVFRMKTNDDSFFTNSLN